MFAFGMIFMATEFHSQLKGQVIFPKTLTQWVKTAFKYFLQFCAQKEIRYEQKSLGMD